MSVAAPPQDTFVPRDVCYRCMRPARVCFCAHVPTIESRVRVVILQHPRESRMPIGTAYMASLCLPGSTLVTGTTLESERLVAAALADPTRKPILLWPGPGAIDLETSVPDEPVTLFVLDGTWSTAQKMLRYNPAVAALPRYALTPRTPSQYRIRREPRAECLSTIEAITASLGALEGDREKFAPMLAPFFAMIDAQISFEKTPSHRHRKERRGPRTERRLPPLLQQIDDLVLVAAEANAWPYLARDPHLPEPARIPGRPRRSDELLHWLAVRVSDGAVFEGLVRPATGLAPNTLVHTRIAPENVASAEPLASVRARWQDFVRPTDVLATWGGYADAMRETAGLAPGASMADLKGVVRKHLGGARGTVEEICASLGVTGSAIGMGRGGVRLGMAYALVKHLIAR